MASFVKYSDVTTSVNKQVHREPFDSQTITSVDFYKPSISLYRHLWPNETFEFDISSFTRLSPLYKPLFGRCKAVHRAFYVPFYQVMKGFEEFYSQAPYNSNIFACILTSVPHFNDGQLVQWFIQDTMSTLLDEGPNMPKPDFFTFYKDGTSVSSGYFRFTELGRYVHSLLVSLGYKVNWQRTSDVGHSPNYQDRNALPLLCYAKIFLDWFFNPNYPEIVQYYDIFDIEPTADGGTAVDFNIARFSVEWSHLQRVISLSHTIQVDANYLTFAWDSPLGPNSSQQYNQQNLSIVINDQSIHDLNGYNSGATTRYGRAKVVTDAGGEPILVGNNGSSSDAITSKTIYPAAFSQFIDQALHDATDYVHRKHLSGNRVIDQWLSLFGQAPTFSDVMRCKQISHFEYDIQFGEVNATTESTDQPLGDYAGKAVGYSKNNRFSCSSGPKEAGMVIGVTYIVPEISFVDGINRFNSTLHPLDFYQGDFDNLGCQAIRMDEVCMTPRVDSGLLPEGYQPDSIFGYLPRYANYKCSTCYDILGGDFYNNSTRDYYNRWHLMVDLTTLWENFPKHGQSWQEGYTFSRQFGRIFADSNQNFDHFNQVINVGCSKITPMKPLWDTYEFTDDDKRRHVNMRVNGSNIND